MTLTILALKIIGLIPRPINFPHHFLPEFSFVLFLSLKRVFSVALEAVLELGQAGLEVTEDLPP